MRFTVFERCGRFTDVTCLCSLKEKNNTGLLCFRIILAALPSQAHPYPTTTMPFVAMVPFVAYSICSEEEKICQCLF